MGVNAQLLTCVEALAKEAQRRGMTVLVEELRTYYWMLQRGRTSPEGKLAFDWSPERVAGLMREFRLLPFDGR